ncbi:C4b-binding protein beta chain isoform X7 [Perognathus longimembris pacificus]|uniref:C4b-binding protein beta chain isoform X7 n=1 Tax=Perognathus longimembris pacificus TaxID=214514 RepID=UPI00201969B3|nr:C4b-binding protein beta chain isoform X7 [Perognathus longimembris pacificus]
MSDHLMCCRIVSCLMIMWLISDSGASCPEPPPVDNSIFIAKEAEGQLWGTYLCTKGYHLVGPDSFWCNDSKEWDASTPECRLGHCPGPVLANGESNSSGPVNVREKVTFKCDDHYILKGSNWSECLGDHTWEPPLPICKSRDCDPPGYPEHGYFDGGAFTSGSVVTYFCKERYHLVGQRELRCLDGEWSGQVPACERNPEAPTPAGQIAFEKALHAFQERKDLCSATKSFLKRLEESGLTVDELKSSLEMKKAELKAKIVQHHS